MVANTGIGQERFEEGREEGSSADRFGHHRPGGVHRGFASMDRERQREIASAGGRIAHQKGKAHVFTPEEARAAGRKGGQSVSRDREHMVAIGRKGGQKRGSNNASNSDGSATSTNKRQSQERQGESVSTPAEPQA